MAEKKKRFTSRDQKVKDVKEDDAQGENRNSHTARQFFECNSHKYRQIVLKRFHLWI